MSEWAPSYCGGGPRFVRLPAIPVPWPPAGPGSGPRVSIVVPVRDNADGVLAQLAEIHEALAARHRFEVIYVDDASTDPTGRRLREASARFPRLRWLRHAAPCGRSAAIRTGVRAARADVVVVLDGAGRNDPRDIPRLLALFESHGVAGDLGLVVAVPRLRRRSPIRRAVDAVAGRISGFALAGDVRETGCGLKLFPRAAFFELPYFDHMHRFLPALFRRQGLAVLTVPVGVRGCDGAPSSPDVADRPWAGIVDLLGVLWLSRRCRLPELAAGADEPLR